MNVFKYIKHKSLDITFDKPSLLLSHAFKLKYETDTYALFYCKECDLCVKLDILHTRYILSFESCEARKMQEALQ